MTRNCTIKGIKLRFYTNNIIIIFGLITFLFLQVNSNLNDI